MKKPILDTDFVELVFQALFEAGENRIGTVCSVMIDILTTRSEAQLCKSKYIRFFSRSSYNIQLQITMFVQCICSFQVLQRTE